MSFDPYRGLSYMSVLHVDLRGVGRPDAATVDALARLHLVLKQAGWELRIRGCDQLGDLIAFMGLDDVLVVKPRREPE